ncbi:hypothetical protein CDD83_10972 [Cordyceps sp. RAO-2017]|nr:hypothetical protein CDD83_10972 [Cordyceps sp. RAO-2017]
MSSLRELYGKPDGGGDEHHNLGVDYVIHYKVPPKERAEAEAGFVRIIEALTNVGLSTEVRPGTCAESLLIFVRIASSDLLCQQVYRARLQDWLHGVRTSRPDVDAKRAFDDEPVSEAERLRLAYHMITGPVNDGGAGITEVSGKSIYVASIFPLHDQAFNKAWIRKWSHKYVLEQADIDEIRDKFGERVAFYFAFLRSYSRHLAFPAALGLAAWLLFGQFSYLYALGCGLWTVLFVEYWKQKEVDLAVQWGVRRVSSIQQPRPEFVWDFETEDPVTGEPRKIYPFFRRLHTQLLQVPFALACVVALGGLVVLCNSLEIFINEVYDGPFKQYLAFLPTVLLVVFTPTFSSVLMSAANALTVRENYETSDAHNAALIQKQFVLNFMTSYMALLFTAFVYIPFGQILLPLLEFWRMSAETVTLGTKSLPMQKFQINPQRISSQMFYFTVTAQIVNFATEVIVPYATHKLSAKARQFHAKGAPQIQDHEEEAEFLKRVRNECELEAYDVTADYREMVMQYGYLSLFSVAWPLAASCFLANNWVELRADSLKIAISCKRPIPWRSDSIGPWLTAIGFLSWLGSITSSAIVYLCSGSRNGSRGATSQVTAWGGLLTILLAEHFYLLVSLAVRHVMSKVESPGLQRERRERYVMKKKLLQDSLGRPNPEKSWTPGIEATEKMTRETLEEEARKSSVRGQGSPEEMFWQRQRGSAETILIGRKLIGQFAGGDTTTQAKPAPSPRA